ncbi:MAG: hypothetical protein NXH95_00715 [Pseudomonadaceae bacterium]|nr:hypothetical protein [Pseudomonadaceae bacterium]
MDTSINNNYESYQRLIVALRDHPDLASFMISIARDSQDMIAIRDAMATEIITRHLTGSQTQRCKRLIALVSQKHPLTDQLRSLPCPIPTNHRALAKRIFKKD